MSAARPRLPSGIRLRVTPFARPHLDLLSPRDPELLAFGLLGHDPDRAAAMAALGPAFTLLAFLPGRDLDGDAGSAQGEAVLAVACGGIMLTPEAPDGSRVGDAWALTGRGADALPLALHRAARNGLARIVAAHRLRRVQAVCQADHATARRWLKRLGFARETREPGMAGVLPGARLHLYALTPRNPKEDPA